MARSELTPTSFDHRELKASLIEFLKSKDTFADFDYEGSAINTIVDLLTRNTVYDGFLANMLANESFIDSAQIRGNVVAHAQKLSYTPRSRIATRAICNIEITPARAPSETFTLTTEPGLILLSSIAGETYTFTTKDSYTFSYNRNSGKFYANDIELYQGYFIRRRVAYNGERITIPSSMIDTTTLRVFVEDEVVLPYSQATSIAELGSANAVYFLRENSFGEYEISFGENILGVEPAIGSTVVLEYIDTQKEHANGAKSFIAGSTIGGYSNIQINVVQGGYGGMDAEDIESIRFMAPKVYQSQDRALSPIDYVNLTKREFPFLRSVISWGGEDHNPPRYGTQYISVVADTGIEVTDTLKRRIENAIRRKGVGSITPLVIDPNIFNIDMTIEYIVREGVSTSSRSTIEAKIAELVAEYSELNLTKFNRYYNEADFIDLIKEIREIESVSISKKISHELQSQRLFEYRYTVNYDNRVTPRTVKVLGFQIHGSAVSSEGIYDDGEGNLIHEYTRSGVVRTEKIGTVNYDSGLVEFTATLIQQDGLITVQCEVDSRNFYVRHNNVVRIASVSSKEITRPSRN